MARERHCALPTTPASVRRRTAWEAGHARDGCATTRTRSKCATHRARDAPRAVSIRRAHARVRRQAAWHRVYATWSRSGRAARRAGRQGRMTVPEAGPRDPATCTWTATGGCVGRDHGRGCGGLSPRDTVCFTQRDGLPVDHVRQMHEDADGTMWLGTYGGGSRAPARRQVRDARPTARAARGRHCRSCSRTTTITWWPAGNHGIQRLSRRQANECLDGKRTRVDVVGYGRESGLRNPEGSVACQPARERRPAVLLHVRRTRGDRPEAHARSRLAARAARRGRERRRPRAARGQAGGFDVPAGTGSHRDPVHRVRAARGRAAALRVPARRRADRDWVDAGANRVATYMNVPPGRCTFRLRATSGGGLPMSMTRPSRSSSGRASGRRRCSRCSRSPRWSPLAGAARYAKARALALRARPELQAGGGRAHRGTGTREAAQRGRASPPSRRRRGALAAAFDRARGRASSCEHQPRSSVRRSRFIHGPLHDVRAGERRPTTWRRPARRWTSRSTTPRDWPAFVDQLLDTARAEAGELRIESTPGDLAGFAASPRRSRRSPTASASRSSESCRDADRGRVRSVRASKRCSATCSGTRSSSRRPADASN